MGNKLRVDASTSYGKPKLAVVQYKPRSPCSLAAVLSSVCVLAMILVHNKIQLSDTLLRSLDNHIHMTWSQDSLPTYLQCQPQGMHPRSLVTTTPHAGWL